MNGATPNDDARRADDEAVEWLILLREQPADRDVRARFDAWLAASPSNARAWAYTADAYDLAGHTRSAFTPAGGTRQDRAAAATAGVRRDSVRRRWLVAVAAAACVGLAAAPSMLLHIQADHLTGTAELNEVALADGSLAHLAPGSALAVDFAADRRHVRLLKGEAWFDVRHDPSRPFRVDAAGVGTTVLGTAFDVRIDAGGVTTEVARGRVRVAGVDGIVSELGPGDFLRVAFDGARSVATRPAGDVATWRHRQIVVHDRPVSEVIDALRPWFGGTIVVRGSSFTRQRVTGVYNAADPVEALHGLTQVYGGRVTQITPWVILLTER